MDRNAATAVCNWSERPTNWPDGVPHPTAKAVKMTEDPRAYLEYRRILLALTAVSNGKLTLRQVEFALYNAGRKDERVTGL